jgi:hypothetical protein
MERGLEGIWGKEGRKLMYESDREKEISKK